MSGIVSRSACRASFTAPTITAAATGERPTGEGKLYLCAIKDVYSGRIVGYSIDARMTSQLAVDALRNAIARLTEGRTAITIKRYG